MTIPLNARACTRLGSGGIVAHCGACGRTLTPATSFGSYSRTSTGSCPIWIVARSWRYLNASVYQQSCARCTQDKKTPMGVSSGRRSMHSSERRGHGSRQIGHEAPRCFRLTAAPTGDSTRDTPTRPTTCRAAGTSYAGAACESALPARASRRASGWDGIGGLWKEPSQTGPETLDAAPCASRAKIGIEGLLALCAWVARRPAAGQGEGGEPCPAHPSSRFPPPRTAMGPRLWDQWSVVQQQRLLRLLSRLLERQLDQGVIWGEEGEHDRAAGHA